MKVEKLKNTIFLVCTRFNDARSFFGANGSNALFDKVR